MQSLFRQKFYQSFKNAVLLAVVLTIAGTAAVTFAQSSSTPPQVTSVTVTTVTNNSAAISFTTNVPAGAKINYGPTTAYGTSSPTTGFTTPERTSHVLTLDSLSSGTTYHFQIEVQAASGTAKSADRTFTTKSASSSSGAMVLTNILAQCDRIRCQISFTPSRNANVRVVWGPTEQGSFDAYPAANIVADPVGTFSNLRRALVIPNQTDADGDGQPDVKFTQGTIYFYRLQAFEEGVPGPSLTTENFQLRTAQNDGDFTFSTGGCLLPNGTTINIDQCGPGGYYCPSGGGPAVQDCTKPCGYICPADSTCRTSGACEGDPSLSGSPFQCNKTTGGVSACYDENGQFRNPAPAGCYGTWGKCNANTILKVRKDRGCNLWLTCATSVQTEAKVGAPAENLCLTLAACNSLNQQGQCNRYLPQGQCDNDPLRFCATDADCSAEGSCNLPQVDQPTQALKDLTFTTPTEIKQIAKLSGSVTAGLDWNQVSGANVIQGGLPWQLMQQFGGTTELKNGDFEYNPPSIEDWVTVPVSADPKPKINIDFEEVNASVNHVLKVVPKVIVTDGTYIQFSGAASDAYTANSRENYYAEARVRSKSGNLKLRFQFGFSNYQEFQVGAIPTGVNFTATPAWQRVTIGPFNGMSGETRVAIVCAETSDCGEFWIDDVQVRPYLQTNTNPTLLTPSCRLYPKADSPACDYIDPSGVLYKGWKGFCLENDSVTGTCLSWWPVDILRGESSIFGTENTAGYTDRTPLYLCAETKGNFNNPDPLNNLTTFAQTSGRTATCDGGATSVNICGQSLKHYQVMTTQVVAAHYDWGGNDFSCDHIENSVCESSKDSANNPRGYCSCDNGGTSSGFKPATGADANIYKSSVEYFRVVVQRKSPRWINRGPDEIIIGPETENAQGDWTASIGWFGDPATGDSSTWTVHWDSVTGRLRGYTYSQSEWTAGDNCDKAGDINCAGLYAIGMFAMKEQCTKIVQVVKPSVSPMSFASRVNDNSYIVPNLQYGKDQDLSPFGGALQPRTQGTVQSTDPVTWSSALNGEAPDTGGTFNSFDAPYQARSGSAFACQGNCTRLCSTVAPGAATYPTCTSDSDCTGLTTSNGAVAISDYDSTPGLSVRGRCVGVPAGGTTAAPVWGGASKGAQTLSPTQTNNAANSYFSQMRMMRLFAQSYGVWTTNRCTLDATRACLVDSDCAGVGLCQGRDGIYAKLANSDNPSSPSFVGWLPPTQICPTGPTGKPERPNYPNDYCAVPPQVIEGSAKFLTGSGNITTITGGSGSVGIKFNTDADREQVPLQEFTINWGDRTNSYTFPYAPRNDPAKPHIFSHVYSNTGPTCSGVNTSNCCTTINGRRSCNYEISIQVKDNWGWCNNADVVTGSKCPDSLSSWYDTGLRVRVQP